MTFKEATDRLMELGVTIPEIASAIGQKPQSIRAVRSGARQPPARDKWQPKLVAVARERIVAFAGFVEAVEQ